MYCGESSTIIKNGNWNGVIMLYTENNNGNIIITCMTNVEPAKSDSRIDKRIFSFRKTPIISLCSQRQKSIVQTAVPSRSNLHSSFLFFPFETVG